MAGDGRRPIETVRQNRYKLLRMTRLSAVFAGLGAILFALWFARELQLVVPLSVAVGAGSGGIGAVSVGIGTELMMLAAAVVANRLIARWARTSGAIIRRLHLIHSAAVAAVPILLVAWIGGALSGLLSPSGRVVAAAVFSIGALFIGQLALLSALLALFAWQRTRPALTSG
jgi:hypothetical protein